MFQELIDLWKAKSHKYTHKKRVYIKGKPSWRYYYKEHHGGGVTKVDELHVGEAFKVNYKGKEGHFHITKIDGDKITVVHDETGKETDPPLTRAELKAVLKSTHTQALKENVKKKEQSLKDAKSKLHKINAKRRLEQAREQLGEEEETSMEDVLDIRLKKVISQHSFSFNKQGLSTTAKDRKIENFLMNIITETVIDDLQEKTNYTDNQISQALQLVGNPSGVLVPRILYTANEENKTKDQTVDALKALYDKMKDDYTRYLDARNSQASEKPIKEAPEKEVKDVVVEQKVEDAQLTNFKKLDIIEKLHAVGSSILTKNQIELLDELCRHDEVSTEELADDTGKSKRSISSTASSINKRYEKVNEHFTLVDIDQSDRETYLQLDQEELEGWLNDTYEQANKKPEKQEPAEEKDNLAGTKRMTAEEFNSLKQGDRIRIKHKRNDETQPRIVEYEVGRRSYNKTHQVETKRLYFVKDGEADKGTFKKMTISYVDGTRKGQGKYVKMTEDGKIMHRVLNYDISNQKKK